MVLRGLIECKHMGEKEGRGVQVSPVQWRSEPLPTTNMNLIPRSLILFMCMRSSFKRENFCFRQFYFFI